jgi:histidine triad (HIT) family protein
MPSTPTTDVLSPEEVDCQFCRIVRGESEARIVFQDNDVLAFFPTNPATLGHTLVIPTRHIVDIWALSPEEAGPLWEATLGLAHAVRRAMSPDGLNVINSAGQAASQSIFHFHIHVVPRWLGDPIGDIWPPKEPWSGEAKDRALDDLQAACSQLR